MDSNLIEALWLEACRQANATDGGLTTKRDCFARLVADECAKVCEGQVSHDTDWDVYLWNQGVEAGAFAIRAKFGATLAPVRPS